MTVYEMANRMREYLNGVYAKGFNVTREYIEFSAWHMFKQDCNMTEKVARRIAKHLEREYPNKEENKILYPTKNNLFAILNGDLEGACV